VEKKKSVDSNTKKGRLRGLKSTGYFRPGRPLSCLCSPLSVIICSLLSLLAARVSIKPHLCEFDGLTFGECTT
jgi:hypothetical protein